MRRSQFTENEILHLLYEARSGVSVSEICATSRISPRTFYRWRRRYGGLNEPAVQEMRELAIENTRLRNVIDHLSARLKVGPGDQSQAKAGPMAAKTPKDLEDQRRRAISVAAEKCGGALMGRFAGVRVIT